jgi:hypothetical protein
MSTMVGIIVPHPDYILEPLNVYYVSTGSKDVDV